MIFHSKTLNVTTSEITRYIIIWYLLNLKVRLVTTKFSWPDSSFTSPGQSDDANVRPCTNEKMKTFILHSRAKTIKNVVSVNEELTAEEWKRRYEKEKERNGRLKGVLAKFEAELQMWRSGKFIISL